MVILRYKISENYTKLKYVLFLMNQRLQNSSFLLFLSFPLWLDRDLCPDLLHQLYMVPSPLLLGFDHACFVAVVVVQMHWGMLRVLL